MHRCGICGRERGPMRMVYSHEHARWVCCAHCQPSSGFVPGDDCDLLAELDRAWGLS
jgi:hypothetical protein